MNNINHLARRAATLALVTLLALPGASFAVAKHGRGRKQDKKSEKFINGHDARDGRWDGRGPKSHKDDYDDYGGRRKRRRNRRGSNDVYRERGLSRAGDFLGDIFGTTFVQR